MSVHLTKPYRLNWLPTPHHTAGQCKELCNAATGAIGASCILWGHCCPVHHPITSQSAHTTPNPPPHSQSTIGAVCSYNHPHASFHCYTVSVGGVQGELLIVILNLHIYLVNYITWVPTWSFSAGTCMWLKDSPVSFYPILQNSGPWQC